MIKFVTLTDKFFTIPLDFGPKRTDLNVKKYLTTNNAALINQILTIPQEKFNLFIKTDYNNKFLTVEASDVKTQ